MKLKVTIGQKYGPAMKLAKQAEADDYFEECVRHNLRMRRIEGEPLIRAEAEKVERRNLGYYAGYYDSETCERVWRLFKCSHPVLS